MAEYDEALEKAIEDAGRQNVFALMNVYGYNVKYDRIDKWMWWQAVYEVKQMKTKPAMTHEPILLTRD